MVLRYCKFCGISIGGSLRGRPTDFCSEDCAIQYQRIRKASEERRRYERKKRLKTIEESSYAKMLILSCPAGDYKKFYLWVYEFISESMPREEIDDIIKRIMSHDAA